MHLWAAADYGDAEVSAAAFREMDIMTANLRPGVRADGLWDERILPHFRANSGTRCPQHCPGVMRRFNLTCHPGETQVIAYMLFPGVAWRPEFAGGAAPCAPDDSYEHFAEYIYIGGKRWRPRL